MSATILEVFNQDEIDLIFEALEHRRRYYRNKQPQQRVNAACGTIKAEKTYEKYIELEQEFERLLKIWVDETT